MMKGVSIWFLISVVVFLASRAILAEQHVLGKTTWGDWGHIIRCKHNVAVSGFRLRVERSQGRGDDTALNGIQLYCNDGSITNRIYGYWGTWRAWQTCGGNHHVTEFNVRSERSLGRPDDTAANDVEMRCTNSQYLYGHGMSWGTWVGFRSCSHGAFLCGVQARIERPQGRGDDTALNQLKFICCRK